MKKIISVVGARPQFIKAAMISRALSKNRIYKEIVLHTGQHYDDNMSDIFFRDLKMTQPDFILQIRSKRHGEQTARMLDRIEKILIKERWGVAMLMKNFGHPAPKIHSHDATEISCDSSGVRHALWPMLGCARGYHHDFTA